MTHEVGIIGASGYTGGELLRLLCRHPDCRVAWATSRKHAGSPAGEVFFSLRDFSDVVFSPPDLAGLPSAVAAVFDDGGGNVCGCDGASAPCAVLTSSLEAPGPLGDRQ